MIKKLQRKFVWITMASLLAVLTLVVIAINCMNIYQISRKSDELLTMLADNNGNFPENGHMSDGKIPQPRPGKPENDGLFGFQMSAETPFETRYFSVMIDGSGEMAADISHVAAVTEEQAKSLAGKAAGSGKEKGYQGQYRYLLSEGEDGILAIFVDCGNDLQTIRVFAVTSGLVGAVCLALVLILVILFSRRAIRPVLENAEKQKQFITDAGHEIKTPVAIISANTEVIEMCGGESEWTRSIHHQVERLQTLVQHLLTLTKMDEAESGLQTGEFSCGGVVKEAAEGFAAVALARKLRVTEEIDDKLMMKGDEKAVRQLVSILLDNAMKYAPEGGKIRIQLSGSERQIQLSVYNSCQVPMEGDLNRLFDRFYRADESRSRESGGYGIGLSVAQAVVRAHKGRITVRRQEQGICFTAVFPSACIVKR